MTIERSGTGRLDTGALKGKSGPLKTAGGKPIDPDAPDGGADDPNAPKPGQAPPPVQPPPPADVNATQAPGSEPVSGTTHKAGSRRLGTQPLPPLPQKQPAEKPAQPAADKPAQPAADKPADKPAPPAADKPADQPAAAQPAGKPAEPKKEDGWGTWLGKKVGAGLRAAGEVGATAAKATGKAVGEVANTVIDKTTSGVGTALETVGATDLGKTVREKGDQLGDVARDTVKGAGETTGETLKAVGDATGAVAETTGAIASGDYQRAIATAADGFIGPQKPDHAHEATDAGAIGEISSRLDKGEGAYVQLTGQATLPSSTVAGLLSLGAGAALVPDVQAEARVAAQVSRTDDGQIAVTVDFDSKVAATMKKGFEFKADVQLGKKEIGTQVGASVEAKVETSTMSRVEMKFDPKNPADMERLKAMFPANDANGFGVNPAAMGEAIKHNQVRTTVGAEAGFTAKAEVKGNVAAPVAGDVGAGLAGTMGVAAGRTLTFERGGNTTETKTFGTNNAATKTFRDELSTMAGGQARDQLAVTRAPNGDLAGMRHTSTTTTKTGVQWAEGKHDVTSAGTEATRTTTSLTPAGVAAARERVARGESPEQAFTALRGQPGMTTTKTEKVTTDSYKYGANVSLTTPLGEVRLGGSLAVGKTRTEVVSGPGGPTGPTVEDSRYSRPHTNEM